MITTFLARLTPPCKEVAALVSESLDRPLPWSTRLKLHLHYWICDACARYRDQMLLIRRTIGRDAQSDSCAEHQAPSAATKHRLAEAFRAKPR